MHLGALAASSRGLHVSRRQNARRQIANSKNERRKWGERGRESKSMQCSAIWPHVHSCVCVFCVCPLSFSDFQTFRLTFRLVLCLSLLPLNSGRFLQLTLIDICRCCCCYCCCLHLPAIFHLDFISHFGWSASSSLLTIEIDQCAVLFSASTQLVTFLVAT